MDRKSVLGRGLMKIAPVPFQPLHQHSKFKELTGAVQTIELEEP